MISKKGKQKTLAKEIEFRGNGLHTGKKVNLKLKPSKENTGIVFKRIDLNPPVLIPALANFVSKTERGTNLSKDGIDVQTTEHLLAALSGMSINNCLIELNANEIPIMDGSSKDFVKGIKKAGVKEQDALQNIFVVKENITLKDDDSGSEIILVPSESLTISVMIDFRTKVLGTQNATLDKIEDFYNKISSSRTFSFLHELEKLIDENLIKGGNLNNSIIYVDKPIDKSSMEKLKKIFGKKDINISESGILNNLSLYYPNEAARHKLLDVIGDLTLVGMPIQGKIIANKPGHKINTEFAKKVALSIKNIQKSHAPMVDISRPPLMGVNEIMKILPHRPPFLFVDKIFELTDNHVVGLKNVTMNETFFEGHFPEAPVMPGVLQIESMAQVGGILVLSTVPDPENYLTFFMKIDNFKFKHPVLPGDILIFKLELLTPIRRGICNMRGYGFVNNKIVSQGDLMAQIIKRLWRILITFIQMH